MSSWKSDASTRSIDPRRLFDPTIAVADTNVSISRLFPLAFFHRRRERRGAHYAKCVNALEINDDRRVYCMHPVQYAGRNPRFIARGDAISGRVGKRGIKRSTRTIQRTIQRITVKCALRSRMLFPRGTFGKTAVSVRKDEKQSSRDYIALRSRFRS